MTAKETAYEIAKLLLDKKADDVKIVDLSNISDIADYFVVCSCKSAPQVKGAFNHIEEQMEKQGMFAKRKEGVTEGRWIAIDYTDVVVHIFHKEVRDIYAIDALWSNGSNVTVVE